MIADNVDNCYKVTQVLQMLLDITKVVYTSVEVAYSEQEWMNKKTFKDNLNMAAFIVDNGLITICTDILMLRESVKSAKINLGANGHVVLDGANVKILALDEQDLNTPTPTVKHGIAAARTVASAANGIVDLSKMIISMQGVAKAVETAKATQNDPSEEL